MGGILVYALHDDEGNFNKNSLGAISEAAKLASELCGGRVLALLEGGYDLRNLSSLVEDHLAGLAGGRPTL